MTNSNRKGRIIQLLLAFLIIFSSAQLVAQNATCFRIYLKDKKNSPYSVENPSEFLSERAISKRQRYNIPVTEQDLPINQTYIQQIQFLSPEIKILSKSKWMNTVTIFCPNKAIIENIENLDFVTHVLAVGSYRIPDENKFDYYSNPGTYIENQNVPLNNEEIDYGSGFGQIAMHNGHLLHQEGFKGEGMLIAVIDGGWFGVEDCTYFKELVEEQRFAGKYTLIPFFADSLVNTPSESHGTIVTSAMAANSPGTFVGTAPEASYAFIHSEYVFTEELIEEDFWAQGAEIADSIGADVLNSSLGYTTFSDFPQADTNFTAINGITSIASLCATILAQKGVIVCIAAGNDGGNQWYHIGRPADAFDVLTVGACDINGLVASFSSRGYTYDGRVKPDVSAIGVETACINSYNEPTFSYGTSLATPVMAGLCACLWQAMPEYTAIDLMQIIRESGSQFLQPDPELGYGIPDIYAAYASHNISNNIKDCIKVFPNPCADFFTVENKNQQIEELKLYDISGKEVQKLNNISSSSVKISTKNLISGIYFGRVTLKNGEKGNFKIIVK